MTLTDYEIVEIRDMFLPNQGESFDCIAFARAIESAALRASLDQSPAALAGERERMAMNEATAQALGWPHGYGFKVHEDNPADPHATRWYLVMPGGSSLPFNHCAEHPMDEARVRWIAGACNAAIAAKPTLVCQACGADRFKEDCKGNRTQCPMIGTV